MIQHKDVLLIMSTLVIGPSTYATGLLQHVPGSCNGPDLDLACPAFSCLARLALPDL